MPDDQRIIKERQKALALAAGVEWVDPEERLRLEQVEAERLAHESQIAELKAKCEKKGLSFEQEEEKLRLKLAKKSRKRGGENDEQGESR